MARHDAETTESKTDAPSVGILRLGDRDALLRLAAFTSSIAATYELLSRLLRHQKKLR
jgi:hypothetical protein